LIGVLYRKPKRVREPDKLPDCLQLDRRLKMSLYLTRMGYIGRKAVKLTLAVYSPLPINSRESMKFCLR
jgi:hypothetical protein